MNNKNKMIGFRRRAKGERGFSLLEYAGGAAVLVGLVYVTFRTFGGGMEGFFTALNGWIGARTGEISAAQ